MTHRGKQSSFCRFLLLSARQWPRRWLLKLLLEGQLTRCPFSKTSSRSHLTAVFQSAENVSDFITAKAVGSLIVAYLSGYLLERTSKQSRLTLGPGVGGTQFRVMAVKAYSWRPLFSPFSLPSSRSSWRMSPAHRRVTLRPSCACSWNSSSNVGTHALHL